MWRFPAEWEPHAATWIAWPCRTEIWPNLDVVYRNVAKIVNAIADGEPVNLLVSPQDLELARKLCSHHVNFIPMVINDSWTRDTLPTFVVADKQLRAVNWDFNAWGEKFHPFDADRALGARVAEILNLQTIEPGVVLENGAIHTDGAGTLLATRSSVLNANRHISMNEETMMRYFQDYLSIDHTIWLNEGLIEDTDTDGHIDNVACFVGKNKIIMQGFNEDDQNYSFYRENHSILSEHGDVFVIDQPAPIFVGKRRLAISYLNFYIANHAIIMPGFAQPKQDDAAKFLLRDLFPSREIIQIPCADLLVGGGGIHCMTMQQPEIL